MTGFRATPRPQTSATTTDGERPMRTGVPAEEDLTILGHALLGLAYPARSWQVVIAAEYSGADRITLERLHRLPDALFHSLHHVASACAVLPPARRS